MKISFFAALAALSLPAYGEDPSYYTCRCADDHIGHAGFVTILLPPGLGVDNPVLLKAAERECNRTNGRPVGVEYCIDHE